MRISDWSSDVCSSDLAAALGERDERVVDRDHPGVELLVERARQEPELGLADRHDRSIHGDFVVEVRLDHLVEAGGERSEEHTSALQSLMRISYAVFCLKKTNRILTIHALRTLASAKLLVITR